MYGRYLKKQGCHLEILLPILKKKEEAAAVNDGDNGNGNGIRVVADNQQQ